MFKNIKNKLSNFVFGNNKAFTESFDKIVDKIPLLNNSDVIILKSENDKLIERQDDLYKRLNESYTLVEARSQTLIRYKKYFIITNLMWSFITILINYEYIKMILGF